MRLHIYYIGTIKINRSIEKANLQKLLQAYENYEFALYDDDNSLITDGEIDSEYMTDKVWWELNYIAEYEITYAPETDMSFLLFHTINRYDREEYVNTEIMGFIYGDERNAYKMATEVKKAEMRTWFSLTAEF